jgi:hypothetical protein
VTISFSVLQQVTAAQLNLLCPMTAVKASTQSVTNSVTLVNDNDIVFTLLANTRYMVEANLVAQSSATTGNLRLAWAVTGTVAAVASGQERMVQGSPDTATAAPDSMLVQSRAFSLGTNNLNTMSTASTNYYVREVLLLDGGASGGTIQLQFAQFTAVASNAVRLMAGSFAVCRAVA